MAQYGQALYTLPGRKTNKHETNLQLCSQASGIITLTTPSQDSLHMLPFTDPTLTAVAGRLELASWRVRWAEVEESKKPSKFGAGGAKPMCPRHTSEHSRAPKNSVYASADQLRCRTDIQRSQEGQNNWSVRSIPSEIQLRVDKTFIQKPNIPYKIKLAQNRKMFSKCAYT